MRAKKSLGQNFLTSSSFARKIVRTGDVHRGETILEIGPGKGMLTEALLEAGAHVYAVEKDREAYELLKAKFEEAIRDQRLELIEGDALTFSPRKAGIPKHFKLIANIPYYITGALIRTYLEEDPQPETIVFLVQKEVAARIARNKKASLLSLSVKAYGSPYYIETVPARFFKPRPKVDSAILKISSISKNFFKTVDEKSFFTLIRCGFSKKRKVLLNNLTPLMKKTELEKLFHELSLDPRIRAEDASLEVWKKLAERIFG